MTAADYRLLYTRYCDYLYKSELAVPKRDNPLLILLSSSLFIYECALYSIRTHTLHRTVATYIYLAVRVQLRECVTSFHVCTVYEIFFYNNNML